MASYSSSQERIDFDDPLLANQLFGPRNAHLDLLAAASGAQIGSRGASVFFSSPDHAVLQCLYRLFVQLYDMLRNGISISFQTPQKEASLLGNEADFKMMIMNLMQNALKAMPDGGSLAVRLSVGKQIKIEIEDTGQGIPADKLKRIFEPFYSQGHSSQHQGTGLGLAIVKSIVEKLNGTIEVKSKPGLGTCFTIKFPLK